MGTTSLAINPTLQPGLTPKDPMVELAPVLRAKVAERGVTTISGGPSELRDLLKTETEAWGDLIRTAGLKAE
jgi:hypothetical protein